jgi:predicted MFS family arabinose efflux permease
MQKTIRARWAVATMFLANGFVMGTFAPQIPLLLPRHGITKSDLGLLLLVMGIGAVLAMLFAGKIIARLGGRLTLRVFAALLIPVLPAVVLAPGVPTLALALALMGAVVGCMDVAMNAQAVEVEQRLGRAIMSSSHGFWSLGGFAGAGLGGLVIARQGAEAHALASAALAGLVVLAAMPFLPAPVAARSAAGQTPRTRLIPRDASLWLLGLLALLAMVPEGAVLDWGALYIKTELGADLAASGLAYSFFAGAMALVRFLGDGLRNRFGAVMVLRISGLIGAAGMMGAALAPTAGAAALCFALTGIGVANMVPVIFSAAGNHPGQPPGAAIGVVTMVGYSGILVAPTTIGFLAEGVGFRATFAGLAALLLVVSLLATRARAAERRAPPTAPQAAPM